MNTAKNAHANRLTTLLIAAAVAAAAFVAAAPAQADECAGKVASITSVQRIVITGKRMSEAEKLAYDRAQALTAQTAPTTVQRIVIVGKRQALAPVDVSARQAGVVGTM